MQEPKNKCALAGCGTNQKKTLLVGPPDVISFNLSLIFQRRWPGCPAFSNWHSKTASRVGRISIVHFFWGTNVHNFRNSQQIIFESVLHRLYKQQDFCLSNSIIDLLQTFTRSQSIWIGKRIPKTLNHRTGSPVGIFKRVGYQMSMLIPFMVGVTWK